ncbi:hypothetical protein DL240_02285 [Lujinxingia litoralis]|uniref:Cation/H+ exchanger domain-containing protein n=1 Tax=Lujinxingia litoralis TaxID=2211119 RepID=A0A328CE16_9DELT|nr:cation:proton antiporter [Lujinxingia litoralis]RAL25063.1 hypothetical protein DL240_02285 [Lujinxingia litoralis]
MRHLLTLFIVVALLVVGSMLPGTLGGPWLPAEELVAIGLMLLLAYVAGELLRRLGLPALLGYIGTGIVLGSGLAELWPGFEPLTLITPEVITDLGGVQILVVGLIGMLAGGKVRLSELGAQGRLVARVTGAVLVTVIPLTTLAALLALEVFPDALALLATEPRATRVMIALFFGVLAFGLSPSTTIALIQDLRARGPLSTATLSVVIVGEFLLFGLFAVLLAGARVAVVPGPLTTGGLAGVLPRLGLELVLSLGLGIALGVAVASWVRLVRREVLIFMILAIFLTYLGALRLEAEPTLVFLVAGFFVQNATAGGRAMVRALEQVALPVFVVYFATVAAGFDLQAALSYLPLVLVLIAARLGALMLATRRACARAIDTRPGLAYMPGALLAQDAVVLVLAGVVAVNFPPWGPTFQSVIMATVIVYLTVGPIALKVALDRAGETRPARGLREERVLGLEEFELLEPIELVECLPPPEFDDAWLRGHIDDLRRALLDRAEATFQGPVRAQRDGLIDALIEFEAVVDHLLQDLQRWQQSIDDPPGELASEHALEALRGVQRAHGERVHQVYERVLSVEGTPLNARALEGFFDALHAMEDRQSLYRIERERELEVVRPTDGRVLRVVKAGRRVRRKIFGAGYRTVPVGRLWRYYVELSLPVQLLEVTPAVAGQYEALWRAIWAHLRSVDTFLEDLARGLEPAESDTEAPQTRASETSAHALNLFEEVFAERHAELAHQTRRCAEVSLKGFGQSLAHVYGAFVQGAARAGTSELPALRYRPSSRFDAARRATVRLRERLRRLETITRGYRAWVRLDHHVSSFVQWSQGYRVRAERAARRALGGGWHAQLERLEEALEESRDQALKTEDAASSVSWEEHYTRELRPPLLGARRAQEHLLARARQGRDTRELSELVEARIERLPVSLAVLSADPQRTLAANAPHYELPLRHWISSQVGREVALRVVDFNERAARCIEARQVALAGVEQLLEFHLVTSRRAASGPTLTGAPGPGASAASPGPAEAGRQGVERALRALTKAREQAERDEQELIRWFLVEWDRLIDRALSPIEERRLTEMQRELARQGAASFVARGESLASELLAPALRWYRVLRARVGQGAHELRDEWNRLLGAPHKPADAHQRRRALLADQEVAFSRAPAVYRRLFVPNPLDIPDFYCERSQVEHDLLASAERWARGAPEVALVSGPRGSGKRSLVRHLFPARLYALMPEPGELHLKTLNLGSFPRDEAAICQALYEAFELEGTAPTDFAGLGEHLRGALSGRHVVVLEACEHVFLRTEEGMERARAFFEMVQQSAGPIFWVLLMELASAEFLCAHLDLERALTARAELPASDSGWLEAMIMARHRVSGFDLHFESPPRGRLERLVRLQWRTPGQESARREFFEALAEHSRHNPEAALLRWLRAVRPDPLNDARVLVCPFDVRRLDVLQERPLSQRLLLAALLTHGSLSVPQAHRVLGRSVDGLRVELEALRREGFVETLLDRPDELRLRAPACAPVAAELRGQNLI